MTRPRRSLAVLSGLAVSAMPALPALGAAVTVTNQARSVHVAIPSIVELEPAIDETITAPDNNPFNQTLDRTLTQLEQTNSASASQESSFGELNNNFIATATGTTSYSASGVEGIVSSDSDFSVTFTLAEERSYSINGSGSFPDTSSGASDFSVTLTGPGGPIDSFTKADFDPGLGDGTQITPTFSNSGLLAPGEYTLAASSGVSGGTNLTQILASYSMSFSAILEDDGTGPPPPPGGVIPLPAAVWPGLAMLGMGAAAVKRRSRQT